jgi:nucleotide-binding universal stress UspA family protein
MFRHVLVPLDGSALAESVMPAAAWLAARLGAEITLLHLIERDAPGSVHGDRHLVQPGEAEEYLRAMAGRLPAGARVSRHVHTAALSDVPRGIVEHARELGCDLTLLCSHGRGGLRAMLFGRIAQQVLADGRMPVLLIRPPASSGFAAERLLAPLDGDPAHERSLDVATDWVSRAGGVLRLLHVVPTVQTLSGAEAAKGRFAPGAARAWLDLAAEEGAAYLMARQAALAAAGGFKVEAALRRGDPATQIVTEAAEWPADLVVIATHGTLGARAFWAGAVGHPVIAHCRRPLLLVPAQGW